MKYRIFSALMVLAMVASLCVVVAAPASANTPNVTINSVTLGTNKAGANSVSCNIAIQGNGENIDAGDVLVFTLENFDLSNLDQSLDTNDDYKYFKWAGQDIPGPDMMVGANEITLYAPVGGNGTFEIYAQAGLGNPDVSQEQDNGCPDQTGGACGVDTTAAKCGDMAPDSFYEVDVNGADMDVYIYDHVKVNGSSFAVGDNATVTATGFSPGASLHLSGGFQGSGVVGADGTVVIDAAVTGFQQPLFAADTTGRKACIPWQGNFNLLPSITVTPAQGNICTPLVIVGNNFAVAPTQILIGGQVLYNGAFTMQDLDGDGDMDDFRVVGAPVPRNLNSGQYQVVAGQASTYFDVTSKQVTVTPAAGPPGTGVTIEGTGFCPGDDFGGAIMMYGNTTAGGMVTAVPIEVDDQGNFTVQGNIPDEASMGMHGVVVFFNPAAVGDIDETDFNPTNPQQVQSQGIFSVTGRELTMVPNNVPFGTMVTLSGGDFGSDGAGAVPDLFVNYQDVPQGDIDNQQLSSGGDIVPATFQVTQNMGFHYGENVVEIRAMVNGQMQSAITTFTVARPTFTIDPEKGPRGTKVTGSGSGWLTGMTDFVTVSYRRADTGEMADVAIVSANEKGDIWTQFTIPSFAVANDEVNLLITARDGKGNNSLSNTYTVEVPTIIVEPDKAAPGDDVTVTGKGFQPKTQIQEVSIGNSPIVPIYELGLTDATGSFVVEGMVPGVMEGGHPVKVRVTQPIGAPITTPFTVIGSAAGAITVEEGFATIAGKYTKVWTFDAATQQWQVYDTTAGAPDDFDTLATGQGYWIEVTEDCTLNYGAHTWNLKKGWNLIGWLG